MVTIYTWKNGDRYEGQFKKGKLHGKGKLFYKNGNYFEGSYKDGSMSFGSFTWFNDDKYVGNYLNDLEHGKGMYKKHFIFLRR